MTPRILSITYQIKLYLTDHPHKKSDDPEDGCLCEPEEMYEYFNSNIDAAYKYFDDIKANPKLGKQYIVGAKLERIIKEIILEL